MPDWQKRCEVVTRENDALRERVAQLEQALGLTADAPPGVDLTSVETQMLNMMLARGFVAKESFMAALYEGRPDADSVPDPKIIDVMICKLRAKLDPLGVAIETKWGSGYFIDKANKEKMRSLAGGIAA